VQTFLQMTLVIGIVAFGSAVYLGTAALHEARPKLPLPLQDEAAAHQTIDMFIWERLVTASAGRKYLFAMICLSLAAACWALGFSMHGSIAGAVSFGVLFVAGAAAVLSRWIGQRGAL